MHRYSNGALFAVAVAIILQVYLNNFQDQGNVRKTRAPIFTQQYDDDGSSVITSSTSDVRFVCVNGNCGYVNYTDYVSSGGNSPSGSAAGSGDSLITYPCPDKLIDPSIWAFGDLPFNKGPKPVSDSWGWRIKVAPGSSVLQPMYAGWLRYNPSMGIVDPVGYANITFGASTLKIQLISQNGCPMFCDVYIRAEFFDMKTACPCDFSVFGAKSQLRNGCRRCGEGNSFDQWVGTGELQQSCARRGACGSYGSSCCKAYDTANAIYLFDLSKVRRPSPQAPLYIAIRSKYSPVACQCYPIVVSRTVPGSVVTTTSYSTIWSTSTQTEYVVSYSVSTLTTTSVSTVTHFVPSTITMTTTKFVPCRKTITNSDTCEETVVLGYNVTTVTETSVTTTTIYQPTTVYVTPTGAVLLTLVIPGATLSATGDCGGVPTSFMTTMTPSTLILTETYNSNGIQPVTLPSSVWATSLQTYFRGALVTCSVTVTQPPVTTTQVVTVTNSVFITVTPPPSNITSIITVTVTKDNNCYPVTLYGPTLVISQILFSTTSVNTMTTTTVLPGNPPVTTVLVLTQTQTLFSSSTTTYSTNDVSTVQPCPPIIPQCLTFGPAEKFNAYFSSDYSGSSDVEGRLGVGGSATLAAGFSIGEKLVNIDQCREITFVVRGKLVSWPSGRNYFGSVALGDNSSLVADSILGQDDGSVCLNYFNRNFFDFTLADTQLRALSQNLASIPITAQWNVTNTDMRIVLQGLPIEIVDIPDPQTFLSTVKNILPVVNYRSGSVIVFNVHGQNTGFQSLNMEALSSLNVVFNFYQATTLTIQNVAVRGWVLAPLATATGATGVIWGSVFMYSMSGSIQINVRDIPTCNIDENTFQFVFPYVARGLNAGTDGSWATPPYLAEGLVYSNSWLLVLIAVFISDYLM